MKNRTKIILGIIITAVAIAAVLFVLFSKSPEEGGEDPNNETTSGFPLFGGGDNPGGTDDNPVASSTPETPESNNISRQKLFKVADGPVAGATAIETDTGLHVRYVEKARGFAYDVAIGDTLEETRLTSNTIPQVKKAHWGNNGNRVVLQYLTVNSYGEEVIRSYSVPIPNSPTDEPFFFSDNALSLTLSADTANVAYLLHTEEGSHLITSPVDRNTSLQVHYSPLREWLLDWSNNDAIYMTTKASHDVPGYLFEVSPGVLNSRAIKITGGPLGLTTKASANGEYVLFSENTSRGLTTKIHNIRDHTSTNIPLRTLAEKCIWGLNSEVVYCGVPKHVIPKKTPDTWYQGGNQFSDSVWVYNVSSNVAGTIVDPETYTQVDIDITDLFLSPDETHLFFTNKRDGSLWGVNLVLE